MEALEEFELLRMELKTFLASWRLGELKRARVFAGSCRWLGFLDFPGNWDGVFLGK